MKDTKILARRNRNQTLNAQRSMNGAAENEHRRGCCPI
jgi:hypothetical protein